MRWKHTQATIRRAFLVIFGLILTAPALAAGVVVHDQGEYRDAVQDARPGDTIMLANGEWKDFEILFTGQGEPGKPITLTAQEKGRVFITGQSNLRIAGQHLVVSGLVFKDGHTPTGEVISFRRNKDDLAYHSRVTETVIDGFNNPERTETDYWVLMYGRNNRFDHNYLAGKSNNGVTMAVRLNASENQQNHHRIDHNFFGPRPVLGSNGGETLRIGTSHYSLTDSFTVVENNWFERCDGEVEIISSKSGKNEFRNNVFFESRGTLTLRHGNGNLVEGNVFLGNGVDHTGGIRVINKRQVVRNNYLSGLKGYRFGSALTVMNGVPDSPINRYHQVEDVVIENNTIIDSDHIHLAAGSDAERSAVPMTTEFRNNLIHNSDGKDVFSVFDDISGITFTGNLVNEVAEPGLTDGFTNTRVELERAENGLMYPRARRHQEAGASRDLVVTPRETTGPRWYPKPADGSGLGSGATSTLQPAPGVLENAARDAAPGDVLELAPGNYTVTRTIRIDRPLTIRAAGGETGLEQPLIQFERNTLFEITEGGALRIEGLHISGKSAPDVAGNSLIRTSRYSMLGNYVLEVIDSRVTDLDVNHSFNFLTASKSTFADRIEIRGSGFSNITGAILELGKEYDDLGLYNAEYLTITDSTFTNVGKALAVLYRGGTDESTFGPHVLVSGSKLLDVGNNKRNKMGASLSLHGVQVATINDNEFVDSPPLKVWQTVGEPVTRITGNRFNETLGPVVENGPAMLSGNTIVSSVRTPDPHDLADGISMHPRLLISKSDMALINSAGELPVSFARSLEQARNRVEPFIEELPDIPVPKNAGGGYTHEQHKRNQATIYEAGMLYQLTGDSRYADVSARMLKAYAQLYPGLGEHPEKKEQSPGRLFWQSLNEAVWLVFAIQGYDAIYESLDPADRDEIENGLFRPMASFLSVESPQTFDRIHNHGTWAVAAVGMTGYVLNDQYMVEQALLGLNKDGEAGFIKQLEQLFSPDGYYTEGPYYQRYALMPFVLFAEVIERNEPQRMIYAYRDGILLKAINATVQLSYGGLFFPINDAIKDKGLDTGELVYAMAIAYARSGDPGLISIAQLHDRVMLNGYGFRLAAAMDSGQAEPFDFRSMRFSDGPNGDRGALGILRNGNGPGHQALVLKSTGQGMGHGHFDRLNWLFFDNGREIVSDYGAARFLNVESKNGGHYLGENNSWAKQTVAHNTLVVDRTSHFGGDWKAGEKYPTESLFFQAGPGFGIVSGRMPYAYDGVVFTRTLLMLGGDMFQHPVVLDVLKVESGDSHRYELPLHFQGHITNVSHPLIANTDSMAPLDEANGYQHLWLRARADAGGDQPFQVTFLNDDRFYTWSSLADEGTEMLFTELGANDPEFNLRRDQGLILSVPSAANHTFISVFEPHGEYNGSREYTTESASAVASIEHASEGVLEAIRITTRGGSATTVVLAFDPDPDARHRIELAGETLEWNGFFHRFEN